jgi:hypothetical protein
MEISLNKITGKVLKPAESLILDAEREKILIEIKNLKSDLAEAYNNFDYASDFLMVDYYTYQIKAFETKFEYLLKKAKEAGLKNV